MPLEAQSTTKTGNIINLPNTDSSSDHGPFMFDNSEPEVVQNLCTVVYPLRSVYLNDDVNLRRKFYRPTRSSTSATSYEMHNLILSVNLQPNLESGPTAPPAAHPFCQNLQHNQLPPERASISSELKRSKSFNKTQSAKPIVPRISFVAGDRVEGGGGGGSSGFGDFGGGGSGDQQGSAISQEEYVSLARLSNQRDLNEEGFKMTKCNVVIILLSPICCVLSVLVMILLIWVLDTSGIFVVF